MAKEKESEKKVKKKVDKEKKIDTKALKKESKESEEPKKIKEVKAVAKYIHTPPKKLRLVIDIIKGKSPDEALTILKFTSKRAAKVLEKVLKSVLANAENNANLDRNQLYISKAFVDQGPVMKRHRARAMGRASAILKRSSHVTIALKER